MRVTHREFLNKTGIPSVHSSTMVFWRNHPVFAWFGGSREGAQDVGIYIYNLHDKGEIITLGNKDGIPRWNPVLVSYDDRIFLFSKMGRFCDCWQTYYHEITSWDQNTPQKQMMGEAQILPAGLNGPVKTSPIIKYHKNDLIMLCGSSVETRWDWSSYIERYQINTKGSKKKLYFLNRHGPLTVQTKKRYYSQFGSGLSQGIIQPSLWEQNGEFHAFYRSSQGLDYLYYSNFGYDLEPFYKGKGEAVKTNIPNPNSGVDTVFFNDSLYLAHNPSTTERIPLTVSKIKKISESSTSADFKKIEDLDIRNEFEPHMFKNTPEFSYPYMVEHKGRLHLTFTYARTDIEYVIIEI